MTDQESAPNPSLRIQEPCPKTWEQLEGGDERRYCSECSLHVHNAARLTRAEAMRIVQGSTERVCMRLERDASGDAIFRDTPALGRLARWTLSAAAGLLAACNGAPADGPQGAGSDAPSAQGPGDAELGQIPIETMGKISVELGDVALPPEAAPPPPEPPRLLGEVSIDPGPPSGGRPNGGE